MEIDGDENLNSNLVSFSFLHDHLHGTCLIFSGFFGAALVHIGFFPQSSKRRRPKSMKTPSFSTGLTI